MAKYHGKNGALLLATTTAGTPVSVASLTQFTLTLDADSSEIQSMGDTWRSFVQGFRGGQLTVSGYFDDANDVPFDAFDASQKVLAYCYPAGTAVARYFYGYVWPGQVGVDAGIGGAVTMNGTFTFDGAVTRVG